MPTTRTFRNHHQSNQTHSTSTNPPTTAGRFHRDPYTSQQPNAAVYSGASRRRNGTPLPSRNGAASTTDAIGTAWTHRGNGANRRSIPLPTVEEAYGFTSTTAETERGEEKDQQPAVNGGLPPSSPALQPSRLPSARRNPPRSFHHNQHRSQTRPPQRVGAHPHSLYNDSVIPTSRRTTAMSEAPHRSPPTTSPLTATFVSNPEAVDFFHSRGYNTAFPASRPPFMPPPPPLVSEGEDVDAQQAQGLQSELSDYVCSGCIHCGEEGHVYLQCNQLPLSQGIFVRNPATSIVLHVQFPPWRWAYLQVSDLTRVISDTLGYGDLTLQLQFGNLFLQPRWNCATAGLNPGCVVVAHTRGLVYDYDQPPVATPHGVREVLHEASCECSYCATFSNLTEQLAEFTRTYNGWMDYFSSTRKQLLYYTQCTDFFPARAKILVQQQEQGRDVLIQYPADVDVSYVPSYCEQIASRDTDDFAKFMEWMDDLQRSDLVAFPAFQARWRDTALQARDCIPAPPDAAQNTSTNLVGPGTHRESELIDDAEEDSSPLPSRPPPPTGLDRFFGGPISPETRFRQRRRELRGYSSEPPTAFPATPQDSPASMSLSPPNRSPEMSIPLSTIRPSSPQCESPRLLCPTPTQSPRGETPTSTASSVPPFATEPPSVSTCFGDLIAEGPRLLHDEPMMEASSQPLTEEIDETDSVRFACTSPPHSSPTTRAPTPIPPADRAVAIETEKEQERDVTAKEGAAVAMEVEQESVSQNPNPPTPIGKSPTPESPPNRSSASTAVLVPSPSPRKETATRPGANGTTRGPSPQAKAASRSPSVPNCPPGAVLLEVPRRRRKGKKSSGASVKEESGVAEVVDSPSSSPCVPTCSAPAPAHPQVEALTAEEVPLHAPETRRPSEARVVEKEEEEEAQSTTTASGVVRPGTSPQDATPKYLRPHPERNPKVKKAAPKEASICVSGQGRKTKKSQKPNQPPNLGSVAPTPRPSNKGKTPPTATATPTTKPKPGKKKLHRSQGAVHDDDDDALLDTCIAQAEAAKVQHFWDIPVELERVVELVEENLLLPTPHSKAADSVSALDPDFDWAKEASGIYSKIHETSELNWKATDKIITEVNQLMKLIFVVSDGRGPWDSRPVEVDTDTYSQDSNKNNAQKKEKKKKKPTIRFRQYRGSPLMMPPLYILIEIVQILMFRVVAGYVTSLQLLEFLAKILQVRGLSDVKKAEKRFETLPDGVLMHRYRAMFLVQQCSRLLELFQAGPIPSTWLSSGPDEKGQVPHPFLSVHGVVLKLLNGFDSDEATLATALSESRSMERSCQPNLLLQDCILSLSRLFLSDEYELVNIYIGCPPVAVPVQEGCGRNEGEGQHDTAYIFPDPTAGCHPWHGMDLSLLLLATSIDRPTWAATFSPLIDRCMSEGHPFFKEDVAQKEFNNTIVNCLSTATQFVGVPRPLDVSDVAALDGPTQDFVKIFHSSVEAHLRAFQATPAVSRLPPRGASGLSRWKIMARRVSRQYQHYSRLILHLVANRRLTAQRIMSTRATLAARYPSLESTPLDSLPALLPMDHLCAAVQKWISPSAQNGAFTSDLGPRGFSEAFDAIAKVHEWLQVEHEEEKGDREEEETDDYVPPGFLASLFDSEPGAGEAETEKEETEASTISLHSSASDCVEWNAAADTNSTTSTCTPQEKKVTLTLPPILERVKSIRLNSNPNASPRYQSYGALHEADTSCVSDEEQEEGEEEEEEGNSDELVGSALLQQCPEGTPDPIVLLQLVHQWSDYVGPYFFSDVFTDVGFGDSDVEGVPAELLEPSQVLLLRSYVISNNPHFSALWSMLWSVFLAEKLTPHQDCLQLIISFRKK